VRKADNLPPSCAVVTKSGNLNSLETSGPLRACNGTALPLPDYEILRKIFRNFGWEIQRNESNLLKQMQMGE